MLYIGTGDGGWHGAWYCYIPSLDDRRIAREIADDVQARRSAVRVRSGYGPVRQSRPDWDIRGLLGEIAALHPIPAGPDLDAWRGRRRFARSSDLGRIEVRTTTRYQLMGGNARYPGLGGWAVMAKDAGRYVVCVEDRDDDLVVMGWTLADDVPRLWKPLGGVLAIIEPSDLRPLGELEAYADALG